MQRLSSGSAETVTRIGSSRTFPTYPTNGDPVGRRSVVRFRSASDTCCPLSTPMPLTMGAPGLKRSACSSSPALLRTHRSTHKPKASWDAFHLAREASNLEGQDQAAVDLVVWETYVTRCIAGPARSSGVPCRSTAFGEVRRLALGETPARGRRRAGDHTRFALP